MIHKTAIIDQNSKISKNVKIGAYTIIGPNVQIGEGSVVHSHVSILGNTNADTIGYKFNGNNTGKLQGHGYNSSSRRT